MADQQMEWKLNRTGINPACALHEVLYRLSSSHGNRRVPKVWATILDAEAESPEFILRHSEVVNVTNRLMTQIYELSPSEKMRGRSLRYVPDWYEAVASPYETDGARYAKNIVDQSSLDQLANLGDWLDLRFQEESRGIEAESISKLREHLAELRDLLDLAGLPQSMANEFRSKIDHIEWMLDNLDLVGTQAVVPRLHELVGQGATITAFVPAWSKKLGVTLAAIVAILTTVNAGVGEVNGIINGVSEIIQSIEGVGHDGEVLELPTVEEHSVTSPPVGVDEIIDAEVEDEAAS